MSLAEARDRMVDSLRRRGISRPTLLEAFRSVPREEFLPETLREVAYEDVEQPIGEHQTSCSPHLIAFMIEALDLRGHESVLEIGTGSGYSAAVLSRVVRDVYSIERFTSLAAMASVALGRSGYRNVHVRCGDGNSGWIEHALYDAILVGASVSEVPTALVAQLVSGGRLIVPVGDESSQYLLRVTREGVSFREEKLGRVHFPRLFTPALSRASAQRDSHRPSSSMLVGRLLRDSGLRQ